MRFRRPLLKLWLDFLYCIRDLPKVWRGYHKPSLCLSVLAIATISLIIFWHDRFLLSHVTAPDRHFLTLLAQQLSFWGDYLPGILPLATLAWFGALIRRKVNWRRIAIVCLLAASVAGILNNSVRITLGRPRPAANLPDGLYGLQSSAKYHAFPSGHCASSFAAATSLVILAPQAGIPALAVSAAIGWSRMRLERHYPSDVTVGTSLGIFVGLTFGLALKRRRYSSHSRPASLLTPMIDPELEVHSFLVQTTPHSQPEVVGREKSPQKSA
jgi:membrane-associated phospholipid phosphatase